MSLENLKEYARRCATEPEMGRAAREIGMENIEEHIVVSERLGLEWDRADLLALSRELVDSDDLEDVSPEELEQIAGGVCTTTAVVVVGVVVGVAAGAAVGGAAGAAVGGGVAAAGDGGW